MRTKTFVVGAMRVEVSYGTYSFIHYVHTLRTYITYIHYVHTLRSYERIDYNIGTVSGATEKGRRWVHCAPWTGP